MMNNGKDLGKKDPSFTIGEVIGQIENFCF